jgi:hypothetical protein
LDAHSTIMTNALWLLAPLLLVTTPSFAQLEARFPAPPGFVRQSVAPGTFAHYLRNVPLQPPGSPVLWHSGSPKPRQDIHAAVLDISVGTKDLQQCADAVMRLRAEHLFAEGRYDDIHFNFTNGFRVDFRRWMNGQRIEVEGAHGTRWVRGGKADSSHASLLRYLEKVFTYAGTLSLSKELKSATNAPLQGGDVFIRGGSPGHAMLVLDVATHADGRQAFLLAQSYMPAQSIHVVKNLDRLELGSWFILDDGAQLQTPEWTFGWDERKRW